MKAKKWMWPAEIIERDGDMLEIRVFKDGSVKNVSEDKVTDFDLNLEAIKDTKNSSLRKAYAQAAEKMKVKWNIKI